MKSVRFWLMMSVLGLSFQLAAFEEKLLVEGINVTHCVRKGKEDSYQASDNSCWRFFPVNKVEQTWNEWFNRIEPEQEFPVEFYMDGAFCEVGETLNVYLAEPPPLLNFPYVLENKSTGAKMFARLLVGSEMMIPTVEMIERIKEFPVREDDRLMRVLPYLKAGILVQKDQSMWKVVSLPKGVQTWSEWWKGKQLEQPLEEFDFNLKDWKRNHALNFYEYSWDHDGLAERYQWQGGGCIYLVENRATGHLSFVHPVGVNELIDLHLDFAEKRYNTGYNVGHKDGFEAGGRNGYNKGYQAGESDGYNKGYKVGDCDGYKAGYKAGFGEGDKSGYDAGIRDGQQDGYTAGHPKGKSEGYKVGHEDGKQGSK